MPHVQPLPAAGHDAAPAFPLPLARPAAWRIANHEKVSAGAIVTPGPG